jgi:signal peptidase I
MTVIGVSILISLLIWIAAIIDSYRIAKRTKPDYELKDYNRWYVYLFFYLLITTYTNQFALGIKSNLMEAFRTSSSSMYPTLENHDCFLANKKVYKNDDPNRGDVIVFIQPEDRKVYYVQRVVAIVGDTVEMKNNQLFINGNTLERIDLGRTDYIRRVKDANNKEIKVEGKLFIERNGQAEYPIFLEDIHNSNMFLNRLADFPKKKIPNNFCFVLGDNRNLSRDSRDFGPIPLSTVKGRAEYLYWPAKDWSRFGPLK